MPRRSKAEKRRLLASDLARYIAALPAVGVFLLTIARLNPNDPNAFLPSVIIALAATLVAFFVLYIPLYKVFKRIVAPKTTPQFNFDDAPASKNHRASQFEYEIAALIQQLTGKRTEVVGGAGDGGIDIKVYEGDKWVGIIQCKNLAANKFVYPAYIRDLNTVKHYHQVRTAYLVSTGHFSDASRELAKELGIRLIDGEELQQLRRKAVKKAESPKQVAAQKG